MATTPDVRVHRNTRSAPEWASLYGEVALADDLRTAMSAELDDVLADDSDDRRRPGTYGVAGLPWCQGATAAR